MKKFFENLSNYAIWIIIIVGVTIYANSLLNNFVIDDIAQIVKNTSVHSFLSIPNIFLNHGLQSMTSQYYRPMPYAVYSILYTFFGENVFAYHLTQLSFHILNAILIFLIFKRFLIRTTSFFLALLFLVHPINVETVVYIANLQEVLFVFYGLIAFYLILYSDKSKYIIWSNIFLFLSILSKETGIVFFAITTIYLYLNKRKNLRLHLIGVFVSGIVYFLFRMAAGIPLQKEALIPLMKFTFIQRLINIPEIIQYYIKTLFFPRDLWSLQSWVVNNINFRSFYLPLVIDLLFFAALTVMCRFVYKRTRETNWVILFILLFLLGLLIHLQIIPIDLTVADHFFYLPFIGLLGIFGLFIQQVKSNKFISTFLIFAGILVLLLLSIRAISRNRDWTNQSTLLAHDIKVSSNEYLLNLLYGIDLYNQGKFKEALPVIHRSLEIYPESGKAWNALGATYYKLGNISGAKEAFSRSISVNNYQEAYEGMGLLLKENDSVQQALSFLVTATGKYPYNAKLWLYRLIVALKIGDRNDALISAKNYYVLTKSNESYIVYSRLQRNLPVEIK